jgi:hypothetical protein
VHITTCVSFSADKEKQDITGFGLNAFSVLRGGSYNAKLTG